MASRSQVTVEMDLSKIVPKIENATEVVEMALSQQVLKDSNFYIPKRDGNLEKSGILASNLKKGELVWDAPYADRVYKAVGMTIQRKVNPNASKQWFDKAKSVHLASWINFTGKEYSKHLKG